MIAVNDRRPITNAGIVLAGVLLSPSSAGEDTKSWETQWHFKIAGPFMNFIISLIAMGPRQP